MNDETTTVNPNPPEKTSQFILSAGQQEQRGLAIESKCASLNADSQRAKVLRFILHRSNDLIRGCISTALAGCPVSLETLSRSLIEELINAQWISLSEENAIAQILESRKQWHKCMKINVLNGYSKIVNKSSGKPLDRSEFSDLISKSNPTSSPSLSIEEKSKVTGLHALYSTVYRPLSITAHGNDYTSDTPPQKKWLKIETLVSVFVVLHEAILCSIEYFFEHGKNVPPEVLISILIPPHSK